MTMVFRSFSLFNMKDGDWFSYIIVIDARSLDNQWSWLLFLLRLVQKVFFFFFLETLQFRMPRKNPDHLVWHIKKRITGCLRGSTQRSKSPLTSTWTHVWKTYYFQIKWAIHVKITFFPGGPGSPTVPSPPEHLQNKQQQVLSATLTLGEGREDIWWHCFPNTLISSPVWSRHLSVSEACSPLKWPCSRENAWAILYHPSFVLWSAFSSIWGSRIQLEDLLCSQNAISLGMTNSLYTNLCDFLFPPIPALIIAWNRVHWKILLKQCVWQDLQTTSYMFNVSEALAGEGWGSMRRVFLCLLWPKIHSSYILYLNI